MKEKKLLVDGSGNKLASILRSLGAVNLDVLKEESFLEIKNFSKPLALVAEEEFSSDSVFETIRKELKKRGIELLNPPELPSRRYVLALWAIALDQSKKGKNEYLEELLRLSRKFNPNTLGFHPRLVGHLQRMANPQRASVEQEFSLGFLKYYDDFQDEIGGRVTVLESEGNGTILSWTLSPYLYAKLKEKFFPRQAMFLVLRWCQFNNENLVIGLSYTPEAVFCLDKDQNHPSHRLAMSSVEEILTLGIFEAINEDLLKKGLTF